MKIYAYSILIFMCLLNFSFAGNLGDLLSFYNKKTDLSYKTRQESLGHYVIFTRQDIRRMNAQTLGDILMSLRFFTFEPSPYGNYDLIPAGSPSSTYQQTRIYINDHLVDSSFSHDPLQSYWNYPLLDVDHVEIYFGPAAASIGNVPGIVIIKIYTKNPIRENVSIFNVEANSLGGYSVGFNSAHQISKNFSYSFMFNQNYNALPQPDILGNKYSINSLNRYAFLNINYKNNKIDFSFLDKRQNIFMSDYIFTPQGGFVSNQDYFISFTKLLDDRSLKLHFAWDHEYRLEHAYSPNFGIFLPQAINYGVFPIYLDEALTIDRFSFLISKTFNVKDNNIVIGTQAKFPFISINRYEYQDINYNYSPTFPVKGLNRQFYTIFLQDEYNITNNLALIGDIKSDYYHFSGVSKTKKECSERFGFAWVLTPNIKWKSFLYNTYTPADIYDSSLSPNGQLQNEYFRGLSTEFSYTKHSNRLSFMYAYMSLKNPIELNLNPFGAFNSQETIFDNFFDMNATHYFSPQDSISVDYFVVKSNTPNYSPNQGGFIKLFNKINHIYVYNELIYRNGYDGFGFHINASYTWDSSIKYKFKNGFSIFLKAQNILNSSPKVPVIDNGGDLIGIVPAYASYVGIGLEKLF
ncbi:MAG: TonB-dependent receptor [Candidatus Parvarchaeota archaeon]